MSDAEEITTRSGLTLNVEKAEKTDGQLHVSVRVKAVKRLLLHWGLRSKDSPSWRLPPPALWPQGTKATAQGAAESSFTTRDGEARLEIRLDNAGDFSSLDFVLFFPEENRWDNNAGKNYHIDISTCRQPGPSQVHAVQQEIGPEPASFRATYELAGLGQLRAGVQRSRERYNVTLIANAPGPVLLHWGLAQRSPHEWLVPSDASLFPGTVVYPDIAAETPFRLRQDGRWQILLTFPEQDAPLGISFVLKQIDGGRWIKDGGRNFFLPVAASSQRPTAIEDQEVVRLADEIIQSEMAKNSWTLMHRFNLCFDLLDRVRGNLDGLALLFVWMRYSALRQLDWQRNYNTQPRDLSHSQDRLTSKLADLYVSEPASRFLVRSMLSTMGRGGEGQKIRDEILAIMHRHRIKEVSGHFMEEWHQKLHNNTTPDDIVICEAYLAFLRSDGNREIFYRVLESGGVTKARMESFERPIRTDPGFVPYLKDGLIHDFENFLRTLKSVHSGTDFETAINAAGNSLDDGLRGLVWHLYHHQNDPQTPLLELVSGTTEARRQLDSRLSQKQGTRELVYLDLALEQFLRTVVERSLNPQLSGEQLVDITARLLENLRLSEMNQELAISSEEWERLRGTPRFGREWSLHAKAVLDRIERFLGAFIDRYQALLQSKAEYLGNAFHAAPWAISIFSEEVIRGTLAATLSAVVRYLQPVLRQTAHLGDWQVISRGNATGQVEVVRALRDVQGKAFEKPTVLVASEIAGDEEIPEQVTAVISSSQPDILSHVAVRARDAQVLFATCYSRPILERLKSLRGRFVNLAVNGAGDVTYQEASEQEIALQPPTAQKIGAPATRPQFSAYAIPASEFSEKRAGGKSCNQMRLREKLPGWIHQPVSVAVPFAVFEKVAALDSNRAVRDRYNALIPLIGDDPTKTLSDLRLSILDLAAPDELVAALRQVMEDAGLRWEDNWQATWTCIKRVWASKWNDRAYLSRKTRGISHDDLFMAVLIQQVVEAEYAFVIHTANPFTGNVDELYAELVLGLGETLVGNYPGRALSFTYDKKTEQPTITAFPGKSIGLYGGGLIFRSDSNGEDLPGYAGAGLYDSVMLHPPREVSLDYSKDRLLWDRDFRTGLLTSIARIGIAIEGSFSSPQDIEGVYAKGRYYVVQTRAQNRVQNA